MLVEAKSVSKTYKVHGNAANVVAVDRVDLRVAEGDFVAIVGESGSGKSTLARMLLGLVEPSEGTIEVDGVSLSDMNRSQHIHYRRQVQAVLQDPAGSLNPRKSVHNAVARVVRLHKLASTKDEVDARVSHALEQVGLTPPEQFLDRFPSELSGGQRQRVLLARAVVLGPRVIIADEAVSALDASVKAGVLRLMLDLKKDLGLGYAFITHDLPVVKKAADYVYVMRNGRVVEHGAKEELFTNPKDPYTAKLLAAVPLL